MHNPWTQFKSRILLLDIFIVYVGLIFPAAFFYVLFTGLRIKEFEVDSIGEFGLYILIMSLFCWRFTKRLKSHNIDWKIMTGMISLKRLPWTLILILFQADLILGSGLQNLSLFIVNQFSPKLVEESIKSIQLLDKELYSLPLQIAYYFVAGFAVVIVAPITEEFIFRGIFMHRWAMKWGIGFSIMLTSIVFALVHGDIFILPRLSSAIVFAIAYCNTGLLLVPMTLHAMENSISFLWSLINLLFPNHQSTVITVRTLVHGLIYTLIPLPVFFYFLKWPRTLFELPYLVRLKSQKESS